MLRRSSANDDSGASVTVVSVACIYVFNCETTWEALCAARVPLTAAVNTLEPNCWQKKKRLIPLKAVDKGKGNDRGAWKGARQQEETGAATANVVTRDEMPRLHKRAMCFH